MKPGLGPARAQVEAIRKGKVQEAIVPLGKGQTLAPGDLIAFAVGKEISGGAPPEFEPGGPSVKVVLAKVRDGHLERDGLRLFMVAWAGRGMA